MDAQISSSSGKTANAALETRIRKAEERRASALKALGLCWGICLVTLPLPPIHWFTVPFFFFFGFYLAYRRWAETEFTRPFHFPCPECGQAVEVAGRALRAEWEIICPHCRHILRAKISGVAR